MRGFSGLCNILEKLLALNKYILIRNGKFSNLNFNISPPQDISVIFVAMNSKICNISLQPTQIFNTNQCCKICRPYNMNL